MEQPSIVAIGASAGGMDALTRLAAQFSEDFPAPVFIVNHMSAHTTGESLLRVLNRHGQLECIQPEDGERFRPGHIYLAPPDHHLMIDEESIQITKGARENRSRPSIDPLFRSAAVAHGNRVTGVILTGYLDDGTAGLNAIHRCGGVCVVQDPDDAAYPEMPRNAMKATTIDHCVPLAKLGALLTRLARREHGEQGQIPEDIVIEAKIARRVLSDISSVETLGHQAPYNCPDCGGVLWEVDNVESLRYRCHTGHAFTADALLVAQTEKMEETLWSALRMFEERKNLLDRLADRMPDSQTESFSERAEESEIHIQRIRAMLKASTEAVSDESRFGE